MIAVGIDILCAVQDFIQEWPGQRITLMFPDVRTQAPDIIGYVEFLEKKIASKARWKRPKAKTTVDRGFLSKVR